MINAARYWSQVSIDSLKEDFSSASGPEHPGPGRTSRVLAIAHAAFHDAYVSGVGQGSPYKFATAPRVKPSQLLGQIAGARSTYQALRKLYTRQDAVLTALYAAFVSELTRDNPTVEPIVVREAERIGDRVSEDLYAARSVDTKRSPPFTPLLPPRALGAHDADPISGNLAGGVPSNYGEYWGLTEPFLASHIDGLNIRPDAPPRLDSAGYREAFEEVKQKGHVSRRTLENEETRTGYFWAYDGTRGIGTPPRLYNQIIHLIAEADGLLEAQWSELLCRCNLAMADAAIISWAAKYFYYLWRPVIGIRTDLLSPNHAWEPVGAPGTNDPNKVNFTPPFPAYTSGHAAFGAACFETLKLYRRHALDWTADKIDGVDIEIISDELNGVSYDVDPQHPRPKLPRGYSSIDRMIADNLESRIWLGVHWRFDGIQGESLGRTLAARIYGSM